MTVVRINDMASNCEHLITEEDIMYALKFGTYIEGQLEINSMLEPTEENISKIMGALTGIEIAESDDETPVIESFVQIIQKAIYKVEGVV